MSGLLRSNAMCRQRAVLRSDLNLMKEEEERKKKWRERVLLLFLLLLKFKSLRRAARWS